MKKSNIIIILLVVIFSAPKVFSQANISAGLSYGSFDYKTNPGLNSEAKYTGDGGVIHLDGQLAPSLSFKLSMSDGKFDNQVLSNSEGSITYNFLQNFGVYLMSSQIKVATVNESDTSLGLSYNINASTLGIKAFVGSFTDNYGKFYTYGTNINLGVAKGSSLILSYKTEDRKQKATTMDARFVYDLSSNLGLNLGYKSTETKDANGSAVVLKGNTTYAGIVYRF
jgi:hypothetical protein